MASPIVTGRGREDRQPRRTHRKEHTMTLTVTTNDVIVECLDAFDSPCEGPVEYRMPLTSTGRSFPRCDKHWSTRLNVQDRIDRDYPDSPFAPRWFDPSEAGETWDEEY